MRLVLHPKVYSYIDEIMEYYEQVATPKLANEFYAELRHYMQQAVDPEIITAAVKPGHQALNSIR